jgi:hypothetical protein
MHSISLHHRAVPMKASPLRATLTTKIPLLRDDEPELVETQRRLDDARAMSSMVNGEMTYTDIARIAGWPVEPVNDWKADASSDRGRMSTLAPGDARGDDLYTVPAPGLKLRLCARTLAQGGRIRGLSGKRAHLDVTQGPREASGLSGARGTGTAKAGAPVQKDHGAGLPIKYRLELAPNRSFLVASLSGGARGAVLSIRDPQGRVLPVCERIGLDHGTSKICVVDLRTVDLRTVDRDGAPPTFLTAVIEVAPHARYFPRVDFSVKASDFSGEVFDWSTLV